MKKSILLLLISVAISASAHEHAINQTATTVVANNNIDNSKKEAAKKHSDKAWRGIDKLLTKIMVISAGAGTISYVVRPFTCEKVGLAYVDNTACGTIGDIKIIGKPHILKSCFAITALAGLLKAGVKLKRAHDHGKNIISFIISDVFADIK